MAALALALPVIARVAPADAAAPTLPVPLPMYGTASLKGFGTSPNPYTSSQYVLKIATVHLAGLLRSSATYNPSTNKTAYGLPYVATGLDVGPVTLSALCYSSCATETLLSGGDAANIHGSDVEGRPIVGSCPMNHWTRPGNMVNGQRIRFQLDCSYRVGSDPVAYSSIEVIALFTVKAPAPGGIPQKAAGIYSCGSFDSLCSGYSLAL